MCQTSDAARGSRAGAGARRRLLLELQRRADELAAHDGGTLAVGGPAVQHLVSNVHGAVVVAVQLGRLGQSRGTARIRTLHRTGAAVGLAARVAPAAHLGREVLEAWVRREIGRAHV